MEWVIWQEVPYEGTRETFCENEAEVLFHLSYMSPADLDKTVIEPDSIISLTPWEFRKQYGS